MREEVEAALEKIRPMLQADGGNVELIDIEPGGWIYKDRSVQMQTIFQRLSTGIFASGGAGLLEPLHRAWENRPSDHVLPHGRR